MEDRSSVFRAGDIGDPAVLPHDPVDDAESQAVASRLGGEERCEDPRHVLSGQPLAVVGDLDFHAGHGLLRHSVSPHPGEELGMERDGDSPFLRARRLDGVYSEVQ